LSKIAKNKVYLPWYMSSVSEGSKVPSLMQGRATSKFYRRHTFSMYRLLFARPKIKSPRTLSKANKLNVTLSVRLFVRLNTRIRLSAAL